MKNIIFATGIERSYPTVRGGVRRDQLEETKHYERWRQDFQLCLDVGAKVVRYGPPYYRMHLGPHKYDWSFTVEVMLTETNTGSPENGPEWLWKTWHNLALFRAEGLPVVGYTWFSLQNQVDWDIQLREIRAVEVGNGMYRLDRTANPVAQAFSDLCRRYGDEPLLPAFAMGRLRGSESQTAPDRLPLGNMPSLG